MSKVLFKTRKCWLWFPIRFTTYSVVKNYYDYDLVIERGLLNRQIEKIKLYKINDISYHRTARDFFFGVGRIVLYSADTSSEICEICDIRNYKIFGERLEKYIAYERERLGIGFNEANILN